MSYFSNLCTLCDTIGICKFSSTWGTSAIGIPEMATLISTATGMEIDDQGINAVADRINNSERAYLVREGITRKDDMIHGRIMEEPVPSGPLKGKRLDKEKFNEMLDDYYDTVGWDKKAGIPTRKKLEELGLTDVADELAALGKLSA